MSSTSSEHEVPLGVVLSNRRRLHVVQYLLEEGPEPPIDVGDLAQAVAAIEHEKHPEAVSSNEKHRVYVSLIQGHLDRLHQEDIIRYDDERNVIYPGPNLRVAYSFAVLLPGSGVN
ncbi:hypothetical protein [Halorubrum sp. BV1]|uniref:DUF7344 domain-containing protein n=1 Tax=Halorubrum sp. BV1 TaxID=1498500 RepID=UPI0012BA5733|nr:hypothetical protein [Halorubrum sp. BV1]